MNDAGHENGTTVESQSVPRMHDSSAVRQSELLIQNACQQLITPTECLDAAARLLWSQDVPPSERPELMARMIVTGLRCFASLQGPLAIHALDLEQVSESDRRCKL